MKKETADSPTLPLPGVRWRGFTLQLFLITILPLTVLLVSIVLVSQSLHHREMTALVGDRNLRSVRAAAESLRGQLVHFGYSLRVASRLSGNPPDFNALRTNIDLVETEFDGGLAFFQRDGGFMSASNQAPYWQNLPTENPFFWESLLAEPYDRVLFSSSLYSINGEIRLALAGVRAKDGSLLIGAFTPERLIQGMLSGTIGSPQSTLLVTDASQQTIFQSGALLEEGEQGTRAGVEGALDLESGVNYYSSHRGEIIVAFAPILPAGWSLVIAEAWEETASPFLSTTQSAPLLVLPLLVLALIALWFGARQIVQPIQELERRAARLAHGDFRAIHDPVGGIEEIRRLQNGLERMADDLQSAQTALRGYIGAITAGLENEKRSLARELHDDTLQALIALNQRIQLAALNTPNEEDTASLSQVQKMIQQAMDNLRRLVRGMRPIYLEELGLAAALEMLASENAKADGAAVDFSLVGEPKRLDAEVELALYRMAQEALSNALRHAEASRIKIEMAFGEQGLRLTIRDDGAGFDLPEAREVFARHGHFGLLGLYERADLIAAKLKIETSPGSGTLVEVFLPGERV